MFECVFTDSERFKVKWCMILKSLFFLSIEWQKKNNLTCNIIYNQSVSIVAFKNDKYLITKQRLTTVTRRLRQQARPSAKPFHLYLESSEKWSTVKNKTKNSTGPWHAHLKHICLVTAHFVKLKRKNATGRNHGHIFIHFLSLKTRKSGFLLIKLHLRMWNHGHMVALH